MKRQAFLLPLIGAALVAGFSSCSQNSGGYANAETAQQVADGTMPPWMAEYADESYETGSYTSKAPASTSSSTPTYAYNPPPKPSTSSGKSSSKKSTTKKTTARTTTYTVKKGDTLGHIARRNGTTVKAIKSANGLKSDLIRIGQKLKIPRK